jgi:hypothetical protein
MAGGNLGPVKENLHIASLIGLKLDEEWWRERLFAIVGKILPALIIFDSTARFHTLDENSSREMAYLHEVAFKPLTKTLFDAAVVAADHPPKGMMGGSPKDLLQGVRGSGDKIASADRLWYVTRQEGDHDIVTLHHPGIRTGAIPEPITYRRVFTDGTMFHEVLGEGQGLARKIAIEADVDRMVEYIRTVGYANRQQLIDVLDSEDRYKRAISLATESGSIVRINDPDDQRRKIFKVAPPRLAEDKK